MDNVIPRTISESILNAFKFYPVLAITGARQVGKTTLCKHLFPQFRYVNLEDLSTREMIADDMKKFVNGVQDGVVIEEIHHLPELFSYIQVAVDNNRNKRFILTGSSNLAMMQHLSQSLAGRVAVFTLPPLSVAEIQEQIQSFSTDELLFKGLYPAGYSLQIPPELLYANYYNTYIERDVRQLINVKNLTLFQKFIRLCAGRAGSECNMSALSNEVGVSVPTINEWLSILEASYIIFKLPPFYDNIGKRLTKTPKYYFYDTGILCFLLGIENPGQLETHPLRGGIFENLIVAEFFKARFNKGKQPNCYFYRDSKGTEIDLLQLLGNEVNMFEIKSSQTFNAKYFDNINKVSAILGDRVQRTAVVYDGEDTRQSEQAGIYNWRELFSEGYKKLNDGE